MHNMAKAVQDRVSQGGYSSGFTMVYPVDAAINAISSNGNGSQVVVAGRNVFKIYILDEDKFVERQNLRVGRNLNLNYSILDVAWNPVNDNILASGATNGAIVTWNLAKASKSKQDQVFTEHKRTVNRVCFSPQDNDCLLSGSQDGQMKLFDLRKKDVACTFFNKSENVRDVSFNPHATNQFAAAYENGFVQFWDLRYPSSFQKEFTAHGDHVFTLDWHPEERHWIATAGRDKLIKVWEVSNRPHCTHTIQTIASVARVKWRPQRKYHIASCSLLVDFNINVWDIRRPYIPFAAFCEHKDVVTDIEWRHDPHIFLSSSKDSTMVQHMFKDAMRPADHANPVSMDINIHGDITFAMSDKLATNRLTTSASASKLPNIFRKTPNPGKTEQFTNVNSIVYVFNNQEEEYFVQSAQRYLLSGKHLDELCDHNATVASDLNRHQVAQTWNMVKSLYCSSLVSTPAAARTMSMLTAAPDSSHKNTSDHDPHKAKTSLDNSHLIPKDAANMLSDQDVTSGLSDSESDVEMGSEQDSHLQTMTSMMLNHQGDPLFDEGDMEQSAFEYLQHPINDDWVLPSEAFQVRHEIADKSGHLSSMKNSPDSPTSLNEPEFTFAAQSDMESSKRGQEQMISTSVSMEIPQWQYTNLVLDMLHYYADQGDIQTTVSVLIVLGDKIKSLVDERTQENWLMSYLDLLGKYELWSVATHVINVSNHPAVAMLNQQSTTVHTTCPKCTKELTRSGWLCDRCKQMTNMCSICHLPVKGLYVWCQGCCHGGHLKHIEEWLQKSTQCPTGCGHLCEYT